MKTSKRYMVVAVAVLAIGGGTYVWSINRAHGSSLIQTADISGKYKSITDYVGHASQAVRTDRFTLIAKAKTLDLGQGKTVQALTFNGSSPGPLLTATQGDFVEVTVRNELTVPITVHWHGIAVPGAEDGVPGLTQAPIAPGATFVYRFIAKDAGTYWYHSHVNSVQEVGAGLFGGIIVRPSHPSSPQPGRDYTLLLHEWSTTTADTGSSMNGMGTMSGTGSAGGMSGMGSMGMSGMNMGSMQMGSPTLRTNGFQATNQDILALNEMTNVYDAYTINQTDTGQTLLAAEPGETVRLRLVNAGNTTHLMTLAGVPFKVVALDGHDVSNPELIQNELLPIGAGERYDVEFTMPPNGQVNLVSGDPSPMAQSELQATIGSSPISGKVLFTSSQVSNEPWFDLTHYGSGNSSKETIFTPQQHFDKNFNMILGVGMNKEGMAYTINGRTFPNISPFVVNEGDTVKIHIENRTGFIHPMHLHGHSFQVISRDGKPVTGSPIYLDTLEVLPGETYDIALVANNPGLWMFHCHDLHHAAAGMDTLLEYAGVTTPFNVKDMSE